MAFFPLDANTVALWSFDETSGTTAADLAGAATLTAMGADGNPPIVDGLSGKARQYDPNVDARLFGLASTEQVNLFKNVLSNYTVEALVNATALPDTFGAGAIVSLGDPNYSPSASATGLTLVLKWNRSIAVEWGNNEGNTTGINVFPATGEWVKIAIVKETRAGGTTDSEWRFTTYINGAQVHQSDWNPNFTATLDLSPGTPEWHIGKGLWGERDFNGLIDDIVVSNIARSAADILQRSMGAPAAPVVVAQAPIPRYQTANEVISDAAVELGLGAVADAFGSNDANIIQLRVLLKRLGRQLCLRRAWSQLQKENVFETVGTQSTYNLPADFGRMNEQAAWNRTSGRPGVPADAQVWQYLRARGGSTLTFIFRQREGSIEVWPQPPTAGETVAFEYTSRFWVQSADALGPDKDAPTANGDVLLFESSLLVAALKHAWLTAKGFDSSAAENDLTASLSLAENADSPAAPTVSLSGRSSGFRLLDWENVRDIQ